MRILVTGGAGFIGSHLVDALLHKGHAVTVVDDLSQGKRAYVPKKARFFRAKVQDTKTAFLIRKSTFDIIFHLAAQKNLQYSKRKPFLDAQTNILGSLNVLEAARLSSVKKIIFFSTAAVYNAELRQPVRETDELRPSTPYGIGKLAFEQYLDALQFPHVTLRLANVYGPRQDGAGEGGVVSIFAQAIARGQAPRINNNGKQTRDFIFVQDVVRAALQAMKPSVQGEMNISTAKQTSINDLCSTLLRISGSKVKARLGSKIHEQARSALHNGKARRHMKWEPRTTLVEGLRQTYFWFHNEM